LGHHKILFVSGSLGLGHVTRDISIAKELRKIDKDVEILWLADPPASEYLRGVGESVFPDLEKINNGTNDMGDELAGDYSLSLNPWFFAWYKTFPERVAIINGIAERENVDMIFGDETYDLYCSYAHKKKLKIKPFLLILDFVGSHWTPDTRSHPLSFYMFQKWSHDHMKSSFGKEGTLFIGEVDHTYDEKLGPFLPTKRETIQRYGTVVGYSLAFNPLLLGDKQEIRRKLGYGKEPLIIVTIGGTAIGAPLLKKSADAFKIMKKTMPDLKMVIVQGPRVPSGYLDPVDGMEVKNMVPDLYEHMAAADLVITSGGGSTTTELQALNVPFLFFPIEKHWEQEVNVAYHLVRDNIGVRMSYSATTPEQLASVTLENIGKKVQYPKIRWDGALRCAEHAQSVLERIEKGEIKVGG